MKHTIKTGQFAGVIVTDTWLGGDEIFLTIFADREGSTYGMNLTDEAAAAVIFALEQALETRKITQDRRNQCCTSPRPDCMGMLVEGVGDNCQALKCAGDGLCSVPGACMTPIACGVAA